jgi:hypothetical protein
MPFIAYGSTIIDFFVGEASLNKKFLLSDRHQHIPHVENIGYASFFLHPKAWL